MSEQISFKRNTDLAIKLVVFSTAAALLLLAIYQLRVILLSLFGAMVLASAVAPVAEAGERKKIPRIVTVLAKPATPETEQSSAESAEEPAEAH